MNIVFLINNIRKSGPLKVVESIMYNLPKEDNIYIISLLGGRDSKELIEEYKSKGINIISLKLNKFNFLLKYKTKLNVIIQKIKPDILHSHGILPDYVLSKEKGFYRISTIHCNFFEDYSKRFGIFYRLMANFHFNCLNKLDMSVCCSKYIYDSIGYKIKRVTYIRNGINIFKIEAETFNTIKEKTRKELSIKSDDYIYIYCGKIFKGKRVFQLIKLFKDNCHENEHLVIVGRGPEYEKCKKEENNNVLILGYKNNPNDFYIASDFYISNSSSEGMSISLLEALQFNCKLLLSNIPSHKEALSIDKKNYIGEIFNDYNLREKMDNLEQHRDEEFDNINELISAKRMAIAYYKEYTKGVNSEENSKI